MDGRRPAEKPPTWRRTLVLISRKDSAILRDVITRRLIGGLREAHSKLRTSLSRLALQTPDKFVAPNEKRERNNQLLSRASRP